MNRRLSLFGAALLAAVPGLATADQQVVCPRVEEAPRVDGQVDDAIWSDIRPVVTRDPVAGIDLELRCAFDDNDVHFLVRFPDSDENREHKTLVWDDSRNLYRLGPKREDTFVFKWNMAAQPGDLTLSADRPYRADIWYWKSVRTDHAGYADDKVQTYIDHPLHKARKLYSKSGVLFYLTRTGDQGTAAFVGRDVADFEGEHTPGYDFVTPSGSRADVRAKGHWSDGSWTVEFTRRLDTGHPDDVRLEPGRTHQFGVSRFEIAGQRINTSIEVPEFGAGEVGETLTLVLGTAHTASR